MQHDFLGDAMNCQLTCDIEGVFAGLFPSCALECGCCVLRNVEEVRALEVGVALLVGGVHRVNVDYGLHRTVFEILTIDGDRAIHL